MVLVYLCRTLKCHVIPEKEVVDSVSGIFSIYTHLCSTIKLVATVVLTYCTSSSLPSPSFLSSFGLLIWLSLHVGVVCIFFSDTFRCGAGHGAPFQNIDYIASYRLERKHVSRHNARIRACGDPMIADFFQILSAPQGYSILCLVGNHHRVLHRNSRTKASKLFYFGSFYLKRDLHVVPIFLNSLYHYALNQLKGDVKKICQLNLEDYLLHSTLRRLFRLILLLSLA